MKWQSHQACYSPRVSPRRRLSPGGSLPSNFSPKTITSIRSRMEQGEPFPHVRRDPGQEKIKGSSVIFMSTKGRSKGVPETLKKGRLPSTTWVGLRSPWTRLLCPLCEGPLPTLGKAMIHYKKFHQARKVLLLCKRCGSSCKRVAILAGHVAKCGIKMGQSGQSGDKQCSHCTMTFKSKRGLSQHRLRAHLEHYVRETREESSLTDKANSELLGAGGDLLRGEMKQLFDIELEPVEEPESELDIFMERCGLERLPSLKDVNKEAKEFLKNVKGRMGLRVTRQVRRTYHKGERAEYRCLQQLWGRNVKRVAELVLDGESTPCNISISSREAPLSIINNFFLKPSRTVLIKKTGGGELTEIKNWRPLTLSSVILRLFSHLMAQRLTDACPVHPRQRGFIEGPGASENITVLDGLIKTCKRNKMNLAVVFVDLARSFDTVPHSLLRETLKRRRVSPLTVKLIMDAYKSFSTTVTSAGQMSNPIEVKVGVKQGDPLSPLLFNLALDPLLYALEEHGVGLEFGLDFCITSMAYADDLVIISRSHEGITRNLAILDAFSGKTGLVANPSKCSCLLLEKEGRKMVLNRGPQWTIRGVPVPWLGERESVRYLGVDINPWKGICPSQVMPPLNRMLERVSRAPLKPSQRLHILRVYLLPRLQYACDYSGSRAKELKEVDMRVRRAVKEWLHLEPYTTDGVLYSAFADGGLGLPKFELHIPAARLRRLVKMVNSTDAVTNEVARMVGLESIVIALIMYCMLESDARIFAKWAGQISHGKGVGNFKQDKLSNYWCRDPIGAGLTQSEFITALQLRSNTYIITKGHGSTLLNSSCRLCSYATGTLAHVIGNCPLLRDNRMRTHNNVCKRLADVAEGKGWRVWREHRLSVGGATGVPGLVIQKGGVAHIIDVAICFEQGLSTLNDAAERKARKYRPYMEEVKAWLQ
uniref:Reverse transcriptase domain-containing protein n=1 Tax=Periophthalmus magnuspinnatus TaxID=409849 RepID=A0A3B3ZBK2_9GOBI